MTALASGVALVALFACSSSKGTEPGGAPGVDAAIDVDLTSDGGPGSDGGPEPTSSTTILYSTRSGDSITGLKKAYVVAGAKPVTLSNDPLDGKLHLDAAKNAVTYQVTNGNTSSLRRINVDGTDAKDLGMSPGDHPFVASDGSFFGSPYGGSQIKVMPAGGGALVNFGGVPTTACEIYYVAPSPDRTKVAWYAKPDKNGACQMADVGFYVASVGATAPVTVVKPDTLNTVEEFAFAFTASADKIAYVGSGPQGPAIFTMPIAGGTNDTLVKLPTSGAPTQPSGVPAPPYHLEISKDGKFAYVAFYRGGTRRISIDPPGTEWERVPGLPDDALYFTLVE